MSKLDDDDSGGIHAVNRTVTWTGTITYSIGWHRCGVCSVRTPPPTDDQLIELRRVFGFTGTTVWPGLHKQDGQYMPAGWSRGLDGDLLCPDCLNAVKNALGKRLRGPQAADGG